MKKSELLELFLDLCRIDSPSGKEKSVGDYIIKHLARHKIRASRDAYGNVIAKVAGEGKPLVISAHMDTVEPGRGVKPVVRNGVVRSDGRTILGADDKAGLSYWGKDVEEQELMQRLNTSPETGTYVGDIVRVARELGFNAEVQENLTLPDLHAALTKGMPVIVCGQAWRSRENSDKSAQEDWEDDHYFVVLGMDNKYVYYQDPFAKRASAFVSHRLFEESWHNVRGITSADKKKQVHLGVFISGDTPPQRHPLGAMHITESDLAKFGFLQLVNIRFEGKLLPIDVMKRLKSILNRDLLRPVAYIVLVKDREGDVFVLEGGDLDEEEAVEMNTVIGYLIGLVAGRPDLAGEGAAADASGISERHLQKMAEDLPPGHSALLLILEHVWASRARERFSSLGGSLVSHEMITQDMLIRLGAQLREGQEPKEIRK